MKTLVVFTDGRYSFPKKLYGYACSYFDKDSYYQNEKIRIRTVAGTGEDTYGMKEYTGQLAGIATAVTLAVHNQYEKVEIYASCPSFANWQSGTWLADTKFSQMFLHFLNEQERKIKIQIYSEIPPSYQVYLQRTKEISKEKLKNI